MRVILAAVSASLVVPVAAAGSIPAPTVLPAPRFPPPATAGHGAGPKLVLVSSRYRDPGILPPEAPPPPRWAPRTFHGAALDLSFRQGRTVFLVYGGRYLLGANRSTQAVRYALDLTAFTRAPNRGELEPVTWAREADGVVYVSTSHSTYATATAGRNAYVSAVDPRAGTLLWRSRALVANARTFVVAGERIVTGYGFTAEPDFLYLLDRRTGRVLDRLRVPSAPEVVKLRGGLLHVRAYDRQLVARIRG